MHRKLLVASLVALALTGTVGALALRHSPGAEAATPLPTPSPSFSSIWMSTVSVDRQGSHYDIQAGTFLADQAGDVRVHESYDAMGRSSATWVYDVATHTYTGASDRGDGSVRYWRRTNVSPDYGMRMSVMSPFEYSYSAAAIVRAAQAEHDPALTVRTTTCIGRPAWQASFTKAGWQHTATVDKDTGFPLRYVLADVRHPVTHRFVWRVIDIATDVPVDAASFTIVIPDGVKVDSASEYEHFATSDKLAAHVGYQPFLPSTLSEGSVLATASTQPDPWGPYTWFFPISLISTDYSKLPDNEVRLYYHRGYDWFTVTERPRAGGIGNSVPRELDRRPQFAYRKTVLQAGAFAGKTARTWMGDGAILYVQDRTFAVEIAGDLTRSELLAIAESLQQ
jgi:hypothetical protein